LKGKQEQIIEREKNEKAEAQEKKERGSYMV